MANAIQMTMTTGCWLAASTGLVKAKRQMFPESMMTEETSGDVALICAMYRGRLVFPVDTRTE